MKTVTFRQLRVFTEVARHLSFVRAAEALHLTPPAVTMQVKELESAIELPLFDGRALPGASTALLLLALLPAAALLYDRLWPVRPERSASPVAPAAPEPIP